MTTKISPYFRESGGLETGGSGLDMSVELLLNVLHVVVHPHLPIGLAHQSLTLHHWLRLHLVGHYSRPHGSWHPYLRVTLARKLLSWVLLLSIVISGLFFLLPFLGRIHLVCLLA